MNSIIVPERKIIKPSFRNFNEAIKGIDDSHEHGIDMFCDLTLTNKKGKIEGKKTFECHSFLSNFTKLLCGSFRSGYTQPTVKDISGGVHTFLVSGRFGQNNWYANGIAAQYWLGPMVGTGSTAVTADDYCMEKWLTHGSLVENLSPGGYDSGSLTSTPNAWDGYIRDTNASWTDNQWNGYLCKMTSGTANGRHFTIYDTYPPTSYYLYFSDAGYLKVSLGDLASGDTFDILTYGQMNYGATGFTQPVATGSPASTTKLSISRDFTNGQGAPVTIKEFGLSVGFYVNTPTNPAYYTFLIVRDVDVTGVTVQDSEKMTLTYRIITVC